MCPKNMKRKEMKQNKVTKSNKNVFGIFCLDFF